MHDKVLQRSIIRTPSSVAGRKLILFCVDKQQNYMHTTRHNIGFKFIEKMTSK